VRIPIQDVLAKRVRSSGPRSVVSTWLTDGCSPSLGRLAGAGWCWRSVAGPTTSPSQGSPSARCRCTQPATPSGCGSRSAPRSRLRRRPATPERRRPAHQSVAANVILVGQRSTVHTSLCAAAAVDEESVDTYRQDLASPPPS